MPLSNTIKNISVTYDAINEDNTFTNGDYISGQVHLEVEKECEFDSFFIKLKGKADVMWTERHGQVTVVYHDKDKYFSVKQFFGEQKEGQDYQAIQNTVGTYSNVVAPGFHVFPFKFQIPVDGDMPNSLTGGYGKIIYTLEAKLSRSMRLSSKAKAEFTFVTQNDMTSIPDLMTPQHETKEKKMSFLTSGKVDLHVNIEKMGYIQGEGLKVVAFVQNNLSRAIKTKYSLYRKHSFFARGSRRVTTKEILKEEGDPILPSTSQTVTKVITIPRDLAVSILNCRIIKAEYRLKVYLDVPYRSNPAVKFPLVILPAAQVLGGTGFQPPPPPLSDFGAWNSVATAPPYPTASQFPTAPASGEPYPPPPAYGTIYPSIWDKS